MCKNSTYRQIKHGLYRFYRLVHIVDRVVHLRSEVAPAVDHD